MRGRERTFDWDYFVELHDSGCVQKEIAEIVGCSQATVCSVLKEKGIITRNNKKLSRIEIKKLREENKTVKEISHALNCSQGSVTKILNEMGYALRKPKSDKSIDRERRRNLKKEFTDLIVCDHTSGLYCNEIAVMRNVSASKVYGILKALNLKINKKTRKPKIRKRYKSKDHKWGQKIKNEARFTCALTGQYNVAVEAHHLYSKSSHPELRFERSNMIVVKREIHREFHEKFMGGCQIPCTPEDWDRFVAEYKI